MDKRYCWWNVALAMTVLVNLATAGEELREIELQVAPQTLMLSSAGGGLTVHTDFRYAEFRSWPTRAAVIFVQGIPFGAATFSDSRGYLVAKIWDKATVVNAVDFEGVTAAIVELALFNGEQPIAWGDAVIDVKP